MRKSVMLLGFIIALFVGCNAQTEKEQNVADKNRTAEDLLGLPKAYEVSSCQILLNSKDGYQFKVFYTSENRNLHCLMNADQPNFKILYSRMLALAQNGDKLSITDIIVYKGERQMKWMSKTIEVKK